MDASWPEESVYNFKRYDEAIRQLLKADPKAKILLLPSVNMPTWWLRLYPDDVISCIGGSSLIKMPSPASEHWREDGKRYLQAMVEHFQKSDYANCIIGILPCALQTIEWVYPINDNGPIPDVCKASQDAFKNFVKKKYSSIPALQEAYAGRFHDFNSVSVPEPTALKTSKLGSLRDPSFDQLSIDYLEFRNEANLETLLCFCKTVKDASGGHLLSGSYFGYIVQFLSSKTNSVAASGHAFFERAVRSPYTDVFIAPSDYLFRLGDSPAATMSPADSLRLHGKLWIQEDDIRGYLAKDSYSKNDNTEYCHGKTDTVADSVAIFRKQFALNKAQGYGFWWYDLHGGYYANPEINKSLIGRWIKAETLCQSNIQTPSEIAFVVDGPSSIYDNGIALAWARAQNKTFNSIPAPRDIICLRDFGDANFIPYKLYVFLDCFAIDPSMRDKIHTKLSENGAMAVWLHSAGLFDGCSNISPDDSMTELTGIHTRISLSGGDIKTALFSDSAWIPAAQWVSRSPAPRFFVDDPTVSILSGYAPDVTAAAKDMGSWKSVFFSSPYLPPEALRFLCLKAGVTLYSDANDYFYIGNGLFGMNALASGNKTFKFPVDVDVFSYERDIPLARNIREFHFNAIAGETYLFSVRLQSKGIQASEESR